MELIRALGALCEPPSPLHGRGVRGARPARRARGTTTTPSSSSSSSTRTPRSTSAPRGSSAARRAIASPASGGRSGSCRRPSRTTSRALLGLYASLGEEERAEDDEARRLLRHEARRTLLYEHLLAWTDPYLDRVGELAPPYYRAWGELVRAALAAEAERLAAPPRLPAALREAPLLEPPSEIGGAAFLEQLLAPVRTGFILVRSDLVAASRELGLGLRIAERRYVLEALIGQDGPATLRWLSELAEHRAELHRSEFWSARAAASAALLCEAAREAEEQEAVHAR